MPLTVSRGTPIIASKMVVGVDQGRARWRVGWARGVNEQEGMLVACVDDGSYPFPAQIFPQSLFRLNTSKIAGSDLRKPIGYQLAYGKESKKIINFFGLPCPHLAHSMQHKLCWQCCTLLSGTGQVWAVKEGNVYSGKTTSEVASEIIADL